MYQKISLSMNKLLKLIPNILTCLRFILAFAAPIYLFYNTTIALILLIIASITDFFDGFLARKLNATSDFGRIFDPVADKTLIIFSFICLALVKPSLLHYTTAILFICREFILILGLYLFFDESSISIRPILIGKINAALTFFYICAIVCQLPYIHYLTYPLILFSYYSVYLYASPAVHSYFKNYLPTDHIDKQQKICLVLGGGDINISVYQTAISTFPHSHHINLSDYNIDFYHKDYSTADDFILCLQTILQYELIIFVTPVYWYSTTSYLKIFLDRLADLIYFEEYLEYRAQFAQKKYAAISQYSRNPGYAIPIIKQTCEYMKAIFIANWIIYKQNIKPLDKKNFQRKCFNNIK